jgi:hypothetical protein
LSPAASISSVTETTDPQPSGRPASLGKNEEAPGKTDEDPDDSEPAAEEDIQMEYCSD